MFNNGERSEVETFSLSHHGESLPLSDNFVLGEFACSDGSDEVLIHPHLVTLLQCIRDFFGAPVFVNSGYRTPEYNRQIGGVPKSRHVLGMAADIEVAGVHPDKVADLAIDWDVGGVGRYDGFTHVDVEGILRRWDERTG